ncbi:AraC family transcriptional regulator [Phytopseudomonas dryadis]|uniref:AraC family transcriptional regulator n=1 Tax=Phytopseudomonas dryadis TaxID=2487520 RepID=A0A4Q9R2L5_9GAMM|nr:MULTISPECIES: AraC family transcriptional regulator [Pseudomonas]TBU93446.1 AraC family transcriptional regulator [Pseudomonas dryadis]TBV07045.1 AraC family transcriptional regulator [Pseudomonas dryadis]TBV19561.1 AraC family transcriptional regulator [Pseudomonas sp. FRB 230]
MDPLSDLLSLLRPAATISSGFTAGGDWSVDFADQHGQIKCYAILSGACWMAVHGVAEPVRLEQGDAFVLPRGRPFRLASDLSLPATHAATLFPPARRGGTVVLGAGESFSLAGARFAVHGGHADLLLGLLPPVLHISGQAEQAALRWAVERMMQEMREALPGAGLLAQNLAHMMLVQALRAHLATADSVTGWLAVLSDRRLRRALQSMHAEPARRWTLQELGSQAGMSRTVFATRFRAIMGETPMQYLTRWRMMLACDRLEHSAESITRLSSSLGYESVSAFSTAFKRVLGQSPQRYRMALEKPRHHAD